MVEVGRSGEDADKSKEKMDPESMEGNESGKVIG